MTGQAPEIGVHIGLVRIILRLNVACPLCGETAGYPCRTSQGRYLSTVHVSRDELAMTAVRHALAAVMARNTAARMKACRASATTGRMQQEGNMAAPTITISRTISRTSRNSRHESSMPRT